MTEQARSRLLCKKQDGINCFTGRPAKGRRQTGRRQRIVQRRSGTSRGKRNARAVAPSNTSYPSYTTLRFDYAPPASQACKTAYTGWNGRTDNLRCYRHCKCRANPAIIESTDDRLIRTSCSRTDPCFRAREYSLSPSRDITNTFLKAIYHRGTVPTTDRILRRHRSGLCRPHLSANFESFGNVSIAFGTVHFF